MRNVVLIHNGNNSIKEKLAARYKLKVLPCLSTSWQKYNVKIDNLTDKLKFLNNYSGYITDTTLADGVPANFLFQIKKCAKIYKVIDNHIDNDNTVFGLWLYDELIYLEDIPKPKFNAGDICLFTPGRCGGHLLQEIANISYNNYFHHNDNLLTRPDWQTIINSKTVYSVLRRSFFEYVLSLNMTTVLGYHMLTYQDTLNTNLQILEKVEPRLITTEEINKFFERGMNFVNLLLYLKLFYNQNIRFSFYEDLHHHYDKVKILRNPYDERSYITNLEEVEKVCKETYQPMYDLAIEQISKVVGLAIF